MHRRTSTASITLYVRISWRRLFERKKQVVHVSDECVWMFGVRRVRCVFVRYDSTARHVCDALRCRTIVRIRAVNDESLNLSQDTRHSIEIT